ncbi:hypothetical protein CEXT_369991 [Caerostris extrusa]|uniref:Uncharacterized protein n=1 Tax=Caerostris extrusa TaxID=172846 RepID=A0AAV4NLJ6_CAEEX|nr:hypothetical protein CEXT_369991 [Caerostris extrusa]
MLFEYFLTPVASKPFPSPCKLHCVYSWNCRAAILWDWSSGPVTVVSPFRESRRERVEWEGRFVCPKQTAKRLLFEKEQLRCWLRLQFWRDWSSGPVTVVIPFRESRRERVEWVGRFVCPKQTAGGCCSKRNNYGVDPPKSILFLSSLRTKTNIDTKGGLFPLRQSANKIIDQPGKGQQGITSQQDRQPVKKKCRKKRDALKLSFFYQLECPLGSSGLQLAMGKKEVVNMSHDFLKDQLGRTPTTPQECCDQSKCQPIRVEKRGTFFGLQEFFFSWCPECKKLACPLGSSGLQLAMGKEEVVNVSHDFLKDQLGRTPTTPQECCDQSKTMLRYCKGGQQRKASSPEIPSSCNQNISQPISNWNPLICTIPHVFPRRDSQQNASGCSRFIEVAAPSSGEKALSFLEEEEDMDDRVGR